MKVVKFDPSVCGRPPLLAQPLTRVIMVKLRTLASLVMLLAAVSLARASPLEVDAEEEAISPADSPLQGDESVQGGAVDNDQEDVKEGEEDDFLLDEQPIVESSEDIREDDEPVQIDPVTGARLYKGYKLIRSKPKTEEHLQILKFIANGESRAQRLLFSGTNVRTYARTKSARRRARSRTAALSRRTRSC